MGPAGHAGIAYCPLEYFQDVVRHFRGLGGACGRWVRRMFDMDVAAVWRCEVCGRSGRTWHTTKPVLELSKSPAAICQVCCCPRLRHVLDALTRLHS